MSARAFTSDEVRREFGDALAAAGLLLKGLPIMDGEWHRAAVEGDRGRKTSGRYRGYLNGIRPAGFIENFKGEAKPWKFGGALPVMSAEERQEERDRIAVQQVARERETAARLDAIAQASAIAWDRAAPAPANHPYLRRKGIAPHGTRVDRAGRLLVPMFDLSGRLRDLQRIAPNGDKRFSPGGKVGGLHLLLGELRGDAPVLVIGEGFATGATPHEATGHAVAVAFSKSNFALIARHYQARIPRLRVVFAGDNDHRHPALGMPNVGRDAAEEAQREVGGVVALPVFPPDHLGSDWNDYAAQRGHGLKAVRARIKEALAELENPIRAFLEHATRREAGLRRWKEWHAEIDATHPKGTPGRGKLLVAARQATRKEHGREWERPGQRMLIRDAAGSGKSTLTAALIAELGPALGKVGYRSDRTDNNEAMAARIPGAMVERGRGAPDPQDPNGRAMCWRPEAAEAVGRAGLPVTPTLCDDGNGKVCPFKGSCGYFRDKTKARNGGATVFCGSHAYLTNPGPGLGGGDAPAAIVIDENPLRSLIGNVEFHPDRLKEATMPNWQRVGLADAVAARVVLVAVHDALSDPAGILAGLRDRGIKTAEDLNPALAYLREEEDYDTGGIHPGMDAGEVIARMEVFQRSEISAMVKLLTALQAEIVHPRATANGVAFYPNKMVKVDGRLERMARVVVSYRKRLAFPQDTPVLVLDASADEAIYRKLLGENLKVRGARRARNAVIIQIRDHPMARSRLTGIKKDGKPLSSTSKAEAARLRSEAAAVANALAATYGSVAAFTNKAVEALLAPVRGERVLSEDVHTGHFGALRGRNDFECCLAALILGREEPTAPEMETIARAIWSDDPKALNCTGEYTTVTRYIRTRAGKAEPVTVRVHPDERAQRVLELHREREIEQALDRLRLIHNADPKMIYIATNVPLDLLVDRVMDWPELVHEMTGRVDNGVRGPGKRLYVDRLEEAYRLGGNVLPFARGELLRLFGPEGRLARLWDSEWALQEDLKRITGKKVDSPNIVLIGESTFLGAATISYRLPGQRCPSRALVGLPGDTGREALERLVGPVVAYKAVEATARVLPLDKPSAGLGEVSATLAAIVPAQEPAILPSFAMPTVMPDPGPHAPSQVVLVAVSASISVSELLPWRPVIATLAPFTVLSTPY